MPNNNLNNLSSFFNPQNIAVVGVSNISSKLASVIFTNILQAGFKGSVYAVNPNYDIALGYKCYKKVSDIPANLDLVVIVIPAQFVYDVVLDCVKAKVKNAIIISAGFKEIGSKGLELENNILNLALKNNLRILGPNCLGLIVPNSNLNASFAAQYPSNGGIAFLSQSGAFNTAMLDLACENNVGFSYFVSLGNKSDINELDLVEYWLKDDNVKVIGLYLEEFYDGNNLLQIISENKYNKPIIILKPGISEVAQKAMVSHTGSMAGSSKIIQTALKQWGIIQVTSIEEMYSTLVLFSNVKMPKSNKIALITNAGGPGVIITDLISQTNNLQFAEISENTKAELKKVLPDSASVLNPIDILGDALAERYQKTIEIVLQDSNVDIIFALLTPQYVTQIEETTKFLISTIQNSNKPIIPIFLGGKYVQAGLTRFTDAKIPAFQYATNAISAVKNLVNYSRFKQKNKQKYNSILQVDSGKYINEVNFIIKDTEKPLNSDLVAKIFDELQIPRPKEKLVKSYEECLDFVQNIIPDFDNGKTSNNIKGESDTKKSVVLKAPSELIAHKTDVKALYLNINNELQLKDAYYKLVELVKEQTSKNPIGSFNSKFVPLLVQEQITDSKLELILGIQRDGKYNVYSSTGKGFGHLLVFGQGGIYTEIYKDISSVLIPFEDSEILDLIAQTKVSKILSGYRGSKPLAILQIIDTIKKVQKMILKYPQISSLDINPLLVTQDQCLCVDIKIFVKN